MRIRFDKVNGLIIIFDGTRYLVLFGGKKYNLPFISNRFRHLIELKDRITDIIFHSYTKIKVDSYDFLLLEKYWLFIML